MEAVKGFLLLSLMTGLGKSPRAPTPISSPHTAHSIVSACGS